MEQFPPKTLAEKKLENQAKATRYYEDVDPYTADHRDLLLSQSRMNLMAISQMSDLKANLILTLSAVMLQFALAKVSDPAMASPRAPYWVIAAGALITILFSAYSTLPKAPFRFRERADTGSPDLPGNILFFSTFIPLSLAEYKRHMEFVLRTPPHTHEAILEELHAHGRYIARKKYLPLRMAYISFLLTWVVGATFYLLT
jgi:hypothetical protein